MPPPLPQWARPPRRVIPPKLPGMTPQQWAARATERLNTPVHSPTPYRGAIGLPGGMSTSQTINTYAALMAGRRPPPAYGGAVSVPGGLSPGQRLLAISEMQRQIEAREAANQAWAQRYAAYAAQAAARTRANQAWAQRYAEQAANRYQIPEYSAYNDQLPVGKPKIITQTRRKTVPVLHAPPEEYDYGGYSGGYSGGYVPSGGGGEEPRIYYTGPGGMEEYRPSKAQRPAVPRWFQPLVTWRF